MNDQGHSEPRRSLKGLITAMFVGLAVVMEGLMGAYWLVGLEPRLKAEAEATARAMTHSQARSLEDALSSPDASLQDRLTSCIDEILVLRPEPTGEPFILGVELELETLVASRLEKTLDSGLKWGDTTSQQQRFITEIPLYSRQTLELVGIGKFHCSTQLSRTLRKDVKRGFLFLSAVVLGLVGLAWWIVSQVAKPLSMLATSLKAWDVERARPVVGLRGLVSTEVSVVKAALDTLLRSIGEHTEQLRRAKQYTENIISSMSDMLLVVAPNSAIRTVNQAALELLGYTEDELVGKALGMITQVSHPYDGHLV